MEGDGEPEKANLQWKAAGFLVPLCSSHWRSSAHRCHVLYMLVLICKALHCAENPMGRCCSLIRPRTKALEALPAHTTGMHAAARTICHQQTRAITYCGSFAHFLVVESVSAAHFGGWGAQCCRCEMSPCWFRCATPRCPDFQATCLRKMLSSPAANSWLGCISASVPAVFLKVRSQQLTFCAHPKLHSICDAP